MGDLHAGESTGPRVGCRHIRLQAPTDTTYVSQVQYSCSNRWQERGVTSYTPESMKQKTHQNSRSGGIKNLQYAFCVAWFQKDPLDPGLLLFPPFFQHEKAATIISIITLEGKPPGPPPQVVTLLTDLGAIHLQNMYPTTERWEPQHEAGWNYVFMRRQQLISNRHTKALTWLGEAESVHSFG